MIQSGCAGMRECFGSGRRQRKKPLSTSNTRKSAVKPETNQRAQPTRMPVNIYRVTPEGQKNERIAWLCDDNWRLPDQAEALDEWLTENRAALKPDHYIADIGFSPRE